MHIDRKVRHSEWRGFCSGGASLRRLTEPGPDSLWRLSEPGADSLRRQSEPAPGSLSPRRRLSEPESEFASE